MLQWLVPMIAGIFAWADKTRIIAASIKHASIESGNNMAAGKKLLAFLVLQVEWHWKVVWDPVEWIVNIPDRCRLEFL